MRKSLKVKRVPDLTLLLIIFSLLLFGMAMVYDSSVVYASDLFGGKYYFLILQSFWVIVALLAAFVASAIDYHFFEKHMMLIFLVSFILLLILGLHRVLPEPILQIYQIVAPKINGAYRWIFLNGNPLPQIPMLGRLSFQPSEFSKIALSLFIASLLASKRRVSGKLLKFIVVSSFLFGLLLLGSDFKAALLLLLTSLVLYLGNAISQSFAAALLLGNLVLLQPDFGTAMLLVGIFLLIYFVSGRSLKWLLLILLFLSVIGGSFIMTSSYRRERFLTFLKPGSSDTLSSRYQINQILIAIGSGGFTGLGFGKSVQKYGYVPEVSTDSIFSIVGEEFGFVGTTVMVTLFIFLIYRSLNIVGRLPDEFGKLLGAGIIGFIGLQVFLNLFSMTHLAPLTGVPLPLISYGGSSLVVNLFALGIILNMSRYTSQNKGKLSC